MPSRRQRKRYRRLAANAGLRGDRPTESLPPPALQNNNSEGGRGQLCYEWQNASRGDLILLRHAVNKGWPVPPERRGPLLEAVMSILHRKDRSALLVLSVAWFAVAVERHNQKQEEIIFRAAKRLGVDLATLMRSIEE